MITAQEFEDALNMFRCGMVWDGNLCSKTARVRLVEKGYAVRCNGQQALTGAGALALLSPRWWPRLFRLWWRWKRSPLVRDKAAYRRAMS